jgi:sugar-specific transcriptional regulator TrmB
MNSESKKVLESLGLSKEESDIYLAGLELGEISVQNLAKKANIKRPTAYKILEKLISSGLFYQTFNGKKRFFNAEDPEKLKSSLKQKEMELKRVLPELKSIYNISETKPKVKFYEGVAGAISIYEDTLNSTEESGEIMTYTGIKNFFSVFPKGYAEEYYAKRVAKKITAKIIAIESEESLEWKRNAEKEMRKIFLVPEKQLTFFGDTETFGDKVAFISYKENFMAVVIESREIANMQRFIFNLAWENLENKNKNFC